MPRYAGFKNCVTPPPKRPARASGLRVSRRFRKSIDCVCASTGLASNENPFPPVSARLTSEIDVTKFSAALLCLAFAAAGCGGGSDTKTNSGTPSNSASTSSPTANPSNGADQAIAEGSVLVLGDFPSGWEAKAPDEDKDDAANHRIAKCMGVDYDELYGGTSGDADSKDFENSDDESISNSVQVSPDDARAERAFALASTDKFPECLLSEAEDYIKKAAADKGDVKVGKLSFNQLSFNNFGDESIAYRLTIPMSTQGFDIDVIGDFVLVRVGRATTLISSQSFSSPLDISELSNFAKIATDRLVENLNG